MSKKLPREVWFEEYADTESQVIDVRSFPKWMDDLRVSYDSIFMYFILWKCNTATTMTITKEEFIRGTSELGVDSNEKLLASLPDAFAEICPRTRPKENPAFKKIYKWCFAHFREPGAKNLPINVAVPLLQALLDPARYSPTWQPTDNPVPSHLNIIFPTDFPHVTAFMDYLNSDPKPVSVITKDQFEQFYEFNMAVSWDLDGYCMDTSTWPTLLDNYVTWRKEKYPWKSSLPEDAIMTE